MLLLVVVCAVNCKLFINTSDTLESWLKDFRCRRECMFVAGTFAALSSLIYKGTHSLGFHGGRAACKSLLLEGARDTRQNASGTLNRRVTTPEISDRGGKGKWANWNDHAGRENCVKPSVPFRTCCRRNWKNIERCSDDEFWLAFRGGIETARAGCINASRVIRVHDARAGGKTGVDLQQPSAQALTNASGVFTFLTKLPDHSKGSCEYWWAIISRKVNALYFGSKLILQKNYSILLTGRMLRSLFVFFFTEDSNHLFLCLKILKLCTVTFLFYIVSIHYCDRLLF